METNSQNTSRSLMPLVLFVILIAPSLLVVFWYFYQKPTSNDTVEPPQIATETPTTADDNVLSSYLAAPEEVDEIDLSFNDTKVLPAEIGKFSNLETLTLVGTEITHLPTNS
jgi:Leucine-rich repeat (LRR) protein